MSLYKRDFTTITKEEKTLWETLQEAEQLGRKGNLRKPSNYLKYPKAVRHFLSFFPNYFLDFVDLKDEARLHDLAYRYVQALDDPKATEATIVSFIKQNEASFIIASLLKDYNFGHHDAYLIPEFWLGNTYRVDYLIIGKNSGGYEFIFVELENPYNKITTKDGELGGTFRKGINQVNDWKQYLASNFTTLEETFDKYKNATLALPKELMKHDPTRIHFAVVAGRRSDFNERTYWHKRNMRDNQRINILHYDNLYDSAKEVIGKPTY